MEASLRIPRAKMTPDSTAEPTEMTKTRAGLWAATKPPTTGKMIWHRSGMAKSVDMFVETSRRRSSLNMLAIVAWTGSIIRRHELRTVSAMYTAISRPGKTSQSDARAAVIAHKARITAFGPSASVALPTSGATCRGGREAALKVYAAAKFHQ